MSIVKVIEVMAESPMSWEAAAQSAVMEAGKTVDNIKSVNIKNFQAVVENKEIVGYRVTANIAFVVHE